jgi:hypothetical protein
MENEFVDRHGFDYREKFPKRFYETQTRWEKRLRQRKKEADTIDSIFDGIAGVAKYLERPPDEARESKPISFPYKGVIVTYRLKAKSNAGHLFNIMQSIAAQSGQEEPGEARNPVEQKLKGLIDADPNINFEDYAEELGVEIVKVHRRGRGRPSLDISSGSTYRPPE